MHFAVATINITFTTVLYIRADDMHVWEPSYEYGRQACGNPRILYIFPSPTAQSSKCAHVMASESKSMTNAAGENMSKALLSRCGRFYNIAPLNAQRLQNHCAALTILVTPIILQSINLENFTIPPETANKNIAFHLSTQPCQQRSRPLSTSAPS